MSKRQHWRVLLAGMLATVVSSGPFAYSHAQNASGASQGVTKTPAKSPHKKQKSDSNGQTRGVQLADSAPTAAASIGPYYALVIGINDYRYLNKLKTAVNDATAIAELLQTKYGFQTKLLKDATRSDILTALVGYRQNLNGNSNLLIYYAGHGYNDQKTEEAYWLPVDAKSNNPDNWISANDLTLAVKSIPSLHVMIMADSCYSGDLTVRGGLDVGLDGREALLLKKSKSRSRTLMASGGDEPVSDGGPGGHSIFAWAILEALDQMKGPVFTANDLYRKIEAPVFKKASQDPQYSIIGNAGHEFGDFIFSLGGDRVVAAPGTSPVPRSETNGDAAAIDELVQSYQQAYSNRDASALWGIWPGVSAKTKRKIEDSFKIAGSMQMTIQPSTPEIAADHQDAVVRTQFSEIFTPANSKPLKEQKGPIVLVLKKTDGRWLIAGVE